MTTLNRRSRREFLQKATLLGASGLTAPGFLRADALGLGGRPGANGKIHLGLIGAGPMGRENLANCAKHGDVVVTGICDVWKERRHALVAKHRESARPHQDHREMLERKDIDAVIIATPPQWHALMAVNACEAGKDFYLQKPMTLYPDESLAVRNAVRKAKGITQIGTQIHAGDNFRRTVEWVRSGRLGKVSAVRTLSVMNQGPEGIGTAADGDPPEGLDWNAWVGPARMRRFNPLIVQDAYNHSSFLDYGGGWTPAMAGHIVDLPYWALELGVPLVTSSSGGRYVLRDAGDIPDTQEVVWQYPDVTMTWSMSLANSYGFDFQREGGIARRLGIYFHGVNGTLYADYDTHKVVPEGDRLKDLEPPPKSIPASPGHEREWLDSVKSRAEPSCSVAYHWKIDLAIALAGLAFRLGRSVRFDPAAEKIAGDPEAARLARPVYRDPWKFPERYV